MKSKLLLFFAVLIAAPAAAQTQIRPRVLLMVDTSGSMTEQIDNTNLDTGADGSFSYSDGLVTRDPTTTPGFQYGVGFSSPANQCSVPTGTIVTNFRGTLSKLFAAKTAVNNVLNGSGDIDWGLMRYSGQYCDLVGTSTPRTCGNNNNNCISHNCNGANHCVCTYDGQCAIDEFCIGGICARDNNLCLDQMYSMTDTRGDGTCNDEIFHTVGNLYSLPGSFNGSCGTAATCKIPEGCTGNGDCLSGTCSNSSCTCSSSAQCHGTHICNLGFCVTNDTTCTPCQSKLTCTGAADCLSGNCNPIAGSAASACGCTGNGQCPTDQGYNCVGGVCTYSRGCASAGGVIEVDPKMTGSNAQIFPWVDGIEDYHGTNGPFEVVSADGISSSVAVANPELRSKGNTPLAGAARSAATWYQAIRDYTTDTADHPNCLSGGDADPRCDPKLSCRPYVLVQLTDGVDTCDGNGPNGTSGPPAAARNFVNATVSGARVLNKVYVIGLSVNSTGDRAELTSIAQAGGTGTARFANSQVDIEAALSDIVTSSVLVERCNNADDDCNGACDEPFPDVAVTNSACSNLHAASKCNNGAPVGTHCFAEGVYACSADHLSEQCAAPTCSGDPEDMSNPNYAICPRQETLHGCNGQDDDCNGVVDDCTPFVAGSCCSMVTCPACNPTGVPQPETCNGCDDDCDGVIDDHLMDPAVGVTGGPPCVPLQPGMDQLPCMPGITVCVDGQVQCQGEVLPMTNQCDGVSRDCTGLPNTSGNCPANAQCFQGNCLNPCGGGEFPCPGGYVCQQPQNLCVPDACQKLACAADEICQLADDGSASCVSPCATITCPSGTICMSGVCKPNTCRGLGCPDGQICLGPEPPSCQADPCAATNCPTGQFCNGAGQCEKTCEKPCGAHEVCVDGQCQADPCPQKSCLADEVCVVQSGDAVCAENFCQAGCNSGSVCCGGQCRHDPCAALSCGNGHCAIDDACNASCRAEDQIVGAGGGGCACDVGGRAPPPWGAIAIVLLMLAALRRRSVR